MKLYITLYCDINHGHIIHSHGEFLMIFATLYVMLVIFLVVLILLQSQGSDGLGGLGSSQYNLGAVFSAKSFCGGIAKLTCFVALAFVISTLAMVAYYAKDAHKNSVADRIISEQESSQVPLDG